VTWSPPGAAGSGFDQCGEGSARRAEHVSGTPHAREALLTSTRARPPSRPTMARCAQGPVARHRPDSPRSSPTQPDLAFRSGRPRSIAGPTRKSGEPRHRHIGARRPSGRMRCAVSPVRGRRRKVADAESRSASIAPAPLQGTPALANMGSRTLVLDGRDRSRSTLRIPCRMPTGTPPRRITSGGGGAERARLTPLHASDAA
jgi:hypothetical protein